jgi:hypothetical protein
MGLHQERTHPSYVPGCFACRVSTVGVSAEATPTRRPHAVDVEATEKRWHKDHAAYERLVAQGYQPPRLDGCAFREAHAVKRLDIEHPNPLSFGQKSTGRFEAMV